MSWKKLSTITICALLMIISLRNGSHIETQSPFSVDRTLTSACYYSNTHHDLWGSNNFPIFIDKNVPNITVNLRMLHQYEISTYKIKKNKN